VLRAIPKSLTIWAITLLGVITVFVIAYKLIEVPVSAKSQPSSTSLDVAQMVYDLEEPGELPDDRALQQAQDEVEASWKVSSQTTERTPVVVKEPISAKKTHQQRLKIFQRARFDAEVYNKNSEVPAKVLSLQEVVEMGLAGNYDIQIAKLDPLVGQKDLDAAWAQFTPELTISGVRRESQTPQNARDLASTGGTPAAIAGGEPRIFGERQWETEAEISGTTPIGTEYALTFRNLENEDTTSRTSTLSLFEQEYTSYAGVTISQPLLKGFGFDANLREVRVARVNRQIQISEFQYTLASSLLNILERYFEFLGSWEEYKLREKAVMLTERLRETQLDQVERGLISVAEVSRIEVELSENREEAFLSRSGVTSAKLELLKLILTEFDATRPTDFIPVDQLSREISEYDTSSLIRQAMANRPDYTQAMWQIKKESIELKYYKNQSLPSLDLQGSFAINGLDGGIDTSANRSFYDQQGEEYTIGVSVTIPLGPNPNVKKTESSRLRKTQALMRLKQLETEINLEVYLALEQLNVGLERIHSARRMVENAESVLGDLEDQLERGIASMVDVTRAYVALVDAQSEEIRALREVRTAEARVWFVSGMIMDQAHVVVVK
jgi:outer membrane protein TolC